MLLHHHVKSTDQVYIWEERGCIPFDELIVSWNASRPQHGDFFISISLWNGKWSPWINYALWGAGKQLTFEHKVENYRSYQDTLEVLDGRLVEGFRIKVEGPIECLRSLHASLRNTQTYRLIADCSLEDSIALDVPGLSQMALSDPRNKRICSPTSTAAVLRYFNCPVEIIKFADKVRDEAFDIYGNWVLNIAQAAHELSSFHCCVGRLAGIDEMLSFCRRGFPVVVSVKGPLAGSALPYEGGHLLVVRGYEANQKRLLCMDPGFPQDSLTQVSYPLSDFAAAWGRRQGLAYLFWQ